MATDRGEAIKQGLMRAAKLGRKPGPSPTWTDDEVRAAMPLGTRPAARFLGMSVSNYVRRRQAIEDAMEKQQ